MSVQVFTCEQRLLIDIYPVRANIAAVGGGGISEDELLAQIS